MNHSVNHFIIHLQGTFWHSSEYAMSVILNHVFKKYIYTHIHIYMYTQISIYVYS